MINIAIVDDETAISEKLKSYVEKFFGEESAAKDLSYTVKVFSDGIDFLSSPYVNFDIVFMDICMPMKDGLTVAREFRKKNESACLIFVTNLADMAIKGYEVSALDFVVKPVEYSDFKYRFAKAVKRVKTRSENFIVIMNNRYPVRVAVQSILYVELVYHRVIYHTTDGDLEEWGTMRDAEKRLQNYNFSRCNSGYLVNLNYVDNVRGNVVYINNSVLTVSRNRKAGFMSDMTKFFGGGGK